jgi:hypothetical protein
VVSVSHFQQAKNPALN